MYILLLCVWFFFFKYIPLFVIIYIMNVIKKFKYGAHSFMVITVIFSAENQPSTV